MHDKPGNKTAFIVNHYLLTSIELDPPLIQERIAGWGGYSLCRYPAKYEGA